MSKEVHEHSGPIEHSPAPGEPVLAPTQDPIAILSDPQFEALTNKQREVLLVVGEAGMALSWSEVAKKSGVSRRSIYGWKQNSILFQRALHAVSVNHVIGEGPFILQNLIRQAKDPKNKNATQAAKLILEFGERFSPASQGQMTCAECTASDGRRKDLEHVPADRLRLMLEWMEEARKARKATLPNLK